MKSKIGTRLLVTAFLLLGLLGLSTPSFNPGVVFEIAVTDHAASPPSVATLTVSVHGPHKLKMEILSSAKAEAAAATTEFIYRGDREEVVIVDKEKETFVVLNKATLKAMATRLGAARQEASKAAEGMEQLEIPKAILDRMPEEQRREVLERMEEIKRQMAGANAPGAGAGATRERSKSEYKRTGERATKQGYACVKVDVFRDGKQTKELWVTDWDNIEGGGEAAEVFLSMAGFFEELMDSFGDMMGDSGNGFLAGANNPFANLANLDGFPVLTHEFSADGELKSETLFRSARRQTIDPDAFEPPSGYKRQEIFSGGGDGGA